ncbi:Hypothetical predicted protein, partial [Prunus dulcis]
NGFNECVAWTNTQSTTKVAYDLEERKSAAAREEQQRSLRLEAIDSNDHAINRFLLVGLDDAVFQAIDRSHEEAIDHFILI